MVLSVIFIKVSRVIIKRRKKGENNKRSGKSHAGNCIMPRASLSVMFRWWTSINLFKCYVHINNFIKLLLINMSYHDLFRFSYGAGHYTLVVWAKTIEIG